MRKILIFFSQDPGPQRLILEKLTENIYTYFVDVFFNLSLFFSSHEKTVPEAGNNTLDMKKYLLILVGRGGLSGFH